MNLYIDTILIVLPVFLVVAFGFLLRFTTLVDKDFLKQLNNLVYFVALPALLFHKISTADFSATFNPALLIGMMLATAAVFAGSYYYAFLRGYSPGSKGAFCQGSFRGNLSYIGLAIIFNAYGEQGLAIGGVVLGFLIPFVTFLSILAMLLPQKQGRQKLGVDFWAAQLLYNPLVIASFAGIVWSLLSIGMPEVFDRSFTIITGMSLPLALIAIGASFSFKNLKGEVTKAVLASLVKLVWLPFVTAVVLVAMGVGGVELATGVMLSAAPTATLSYIIAVQFDSDADLSISIVILTTLFSVFTYAAAIYILSAGGF